jgi:hypothetical protein
MCDSNLNADFFNNVAAVAVVLIFTKVVTNRARKAKRDTRWLARLHVGAVVSATAAVGLSLWATGSGQRSPCIAIAAAVALALTAALLIADIVIEECCDK